MWLDAKEACEFEWSQVEFGRSACLHVRRAKNGKPSVHPIRGDELRMFTTLHKENPDSGYVFNTERGTPFTADAINRLVKIIGTRAEPPFPVHFHMLRHSCGYSLANAGADTRARTGWPPLDRAPTALHRAISQSVQGFLAEPDWGVTMNKNNPPWSYIIPVLVIAALLASVPFLIHDLSLQYATVVAVVILWTAAALIGFRLWKLKRDKREP